MDAKEALVALEQSVADCQRTAREAKLLGFHAAIVASQAGEHGKRFAAVAEQIKDLHARTQATAEGLVLAFGALSEAAAAARKP